MMEPSIQLLRGMPRKLKNAAKEHARLHQGSRPNIVVEVEG